MPFIPIEHVVYVMVYDGFLSIRYHKSLDCAKSPRKGEEPAGELYAASIEDAHEHSLHPCGACTNRSGKRPTEE